MHDATLERVQKVDPFMDDALMRADLKTMSVSAVGGGYVILKALEKVLKSRLATFKEVLKTQVKPGTKLDESLFYINHIKVQGQPVLSFAKVRALQVNCKLPEDKVFLVPPIERRTVDLDFLRANVPAAKLDACYETSGETTQIRQGAKGDLKKRLAEVIR
jgi:hypothetical protein